MKTLVQVSNQYLIPRKTLISAVKTGRIPGQKIGRDWFVFDDQAGFTQFLERYRAKEEKNRP